jgi:hypothetical protein
MLAGGVNLAGNADLAQVAHALDADGRFPRLVEGGQEQRNKHGDDANNHQQFDERKPMPTGWMK